MKNSFAAALLCVSLTCTIFSSFAQPAISAINSMLAQSDSNNFAAVFKKIEQNVTALPVQDAIRCNDLLLRTAVTLPFSQLAFKKVYNLCKQTYRRSSNDKEFLLYLLSVCDEPIFKQPGVQKTMLYDIGCFYFSIGSYSQSAGFLNSYLSVKSPADIGQKINAYTTLGLVYKSGKNFDSSILYFNKALQFAKETANTEWIGLASGNLGVLYTEMGRYADAAPHFYVDIVISQSVGSYGSAAGSYGKLGQMAMAQQNLPLAKKMLDSALYLLDKVPPENYYSNARADIYKTMANYYSKSGHSDSGYYYLSRAFSITDSMHNDKNQSMVRFKITAFNLEKQQQGAALLKASEERNAQNERLVILIIVSAMLITSILFVSVRQKQKINRMLVEKSAATQAQNVLIQQQKEKQEQLNKTKDKLLSLIAHDLRGPIGNLKALLALVESNVFSEQEFMEMLPEMRAKVDGVYDVADNLLRWAYAQIDGLTVKPENVAVETIVQKVFALLEADAKRKNILLATNLPTNTTVFADPNLLEIIIRNLVSNAIKFSTAHSRVVVEQSFQNGGSIISVKDNGTGINEGLMERLAKGEFSKPATGTGGEKGIGLGLVMCKEFTEANKGRIWASQNTPKGSVFSIALPVSQADA